MECSEQRRVLLLHGRQHWWFTCNYSRYLLPFLFPLSLSSFLFIIFPFSTSLFARVFETFSLSRPFKYLHENAGQPTQFGMWVYGSDNEGQVCLGVEDASGQTHIMYMVRFFFFSFPSSFAFSISSSRILSASLSRLSLFEYYYLLSQLV